MPHCIIEHAEGFESELLMKSVFEAVNASNLFEPSDIKLRTLAYQHYHSGTEEQSFVHVTLKIMTGRTLAQKRGLSQAVLDKLDAHFNADVSLTVEVVEIENDSYAKIVK